MKRIWMRRLSAAAVFCSVVGGPASSEMSPVPGDEQRAVSVLEQAVKTDPTNAELWMHLGFAYRKIGQPEPSQAAFEKAAALNPRETDALYMLGLIYESKHQTQEAIKAWNAYLAATSDSAKRETAQKHIHQLIQ